MRLLNKQQLALVNKNGLKYRLAEAEKDYFLSIALKHIYDSDLKNILVFKGGTAIHHCYLQQLRFSEDLDFTSTIKTIKFEDIEKIFKNENYFEIKRPHISKTTLKIGQLKYIGPLNAANSLKIEVDFTQNIVLEPRKIDYNNHWGVKIIVNVMDMLEICAEKIRAMSGRARYRDFYDQYMILKNFDIKVSEVIDLVKIKEIRQTISPEHIQSNWKIAKQEKSYDNQRIYYKEVIQDSDIEKMLKSFTFKPIS